MICGDLRFSGRLDCKTGNNITLHMILQHFKIYFQKREWLPILPIIFTVTKTSLLCNAQITNNNSPSRFESSTYNIHNISKEAIYLNLCCANILEVHETGGPQVIRRRLLRKFTEPHQSAYSALTFFKTFVQVLNE